MRTVLLPPGVNPIAINKNIISYIIRADKMKKFKIGCTCGTHRREKKPIQGLGVTV